MSGVEIRRDKAFDGKLSKAAASIRQDAGGRTCEGCADYRRTFCASQNNYEGSSVAILRGSAVACRSWRGND